MKCLSSSCLYRGSDGQCIKHPEDPLVVARECSGHEVSGKRIFEIAVERNIIHNDEERTSPFVQHSRPSQY